MLAIVMNPETWFFGVKFSGVSALAIHFAIGISGMLFGWFIFKHAKFAYAGGLILFAIALSSMLINHFKCWEFDLYC